MGFSLLPRFYPYQGSDLLLPDEPYVRVEHPALGPVYARFWPENQSKSGGNAVYQITVIGRNLRDRMIEQEKRFLPADQTRLREAYERHARRKA